MAGIESDPLFGNPKQIERTDPSEYYLRFNFLFETTTDHYDWMTRMIAIGTGRRVADGIDYEVFEIL